MSALENSVAEELLIDELLEDLGHLAVEEAPCAGHNGRTGSRPALIPADPVPSVPEQTEPRAARGQLAGSGGEQLHVATLGERGDAGVERHQADAVTPRERQKQRVRHLPMAKDRWELAIVERDVID